MPVYDDAGRAQLRSAGEAWKRYLKLDPPAELGVNDELRAMDNAEPEVAGKLQFLAEKTWLEASRSTLLRSFF